MRKINPGAIRNNKKNPAHVPDFQERERKIENKNFVSI